MGRIEDGHWMGCWLGLHCSALTQVENENSSWSGQPYLETTPWHKMTVAVNMSRNDQETEPQTQAMLGETSTMNKGC